MTLPVKPSDIKMGTLSYDISKNSVTKMLRSKIPGADVLCYCLLKGDWEKKCFSKDKMNLSVSSSFI